MSGSRADRAPSPAGATDDRYVIIPVDVARSAELKDSDFRILVTIMSHDWPSNDAGCTASVATIARESHTSKATVKRVLKKLEFLGYLLPAQPHYDARGARLGTTIKLSGRLRTGRPLTAAVPPQSPPAPRAAQTNAFDTVEPGVTVTPPAKTPPRGFGRKFRPEDVRWPLEPGDAGRLRQLEEWGCTDPEDWLAIMLGLLAKREVELKREPDPARLRAIYDGAARSRILHKNNVASRCALLLAGIERRFLLARPIAVDLPTDIPEALRAHVRIYVDMAHEGRHVTDQTLSNMGLTRAMFERAVENDRHLKEEEEPIVLEQQATNEATLRQAIIAKIGKPSAAIYVNTTQFTIEGRRVTVTPAHEFTTDSVQREVVPLLTAWGYEAVLASRAG